MTTSAPAPSYATATRPTIALAGNPNSGKTSLFNLLTGLRRKVANYPGVTVERVIGSAKLPDGRAADVLDLPGTYSLFARSEDERIARDVLLGRAPRTPKPDVVVAVVDASSIERSLFLATQLFELGLPVVVALTMNDVAARRGARVDPAPLERVLGVPVVAVHARTGQGLSTLLQRLPEATVRARPFRMPDPAQAAVDSIAVALATRTGLAPLARPGEALRLLIHASDDDPDLRESGIAVAREVAAGRERLAASGLDLETIEADARYAFAREAIAAARPEAGGGTGRSERLDRVLTHPITGPVFFVAVMALIFQTLFAWSAPLTAWIEEGQGALGNLVSGWLGDGMLRDLLVDGVIAGVGSFAVFLPQICLLFLFLGLLEDFGYLARAAFLIDRVMRGVGLSGRSFVPLLSSFACAIPGIMSTRTIENRRDRFVTILVAPFMSCSARLPVYALMIGAFFNEASQGGWVLLSMYLLSVGAALVAAWILRATLFRGEPSTYVMELPAYRLPSITQVLATVLSRAKIFVTQAGTIILAFSIVLWALAYFPRGEAIDVEAERRVAAGENEDDVAAWQSAARMEQSYMGRMGKAIEPAIEPLGFDWRLGVGVVASFAAREVLVSTLGIVYSVGDDADEESVPLRERLQADRKPDGSKTYTWLTALSVMVFFVLACQCMSTLAVVKRETGSWWWPLFMFVSMTVAAYLGSLVVYQGGRALGFG